MSSRAVSVFDRLISVISYLTAGWGGMIFAVIMYFRKRQMSRFLQFNVFQSIFISLLLFVVTFIIDFIFKILSFIPFINYLAAKISLLFNSSVIFGYSIIQFFLAVLMAYFVIMSIFGRYPRVYKISGIIDYSVGR